MKNKLSLLALLSLSAAAQAAYVDTISSQNPLFYWRFNDTVTGGTAQTIAAQVNGNGTYTSAAKANGSATPGSGVLSATSGAALTPTGGFNGFESGNSWFTFSGPNASTVYSDADIATLSSPLTSMSSNAGSVSYWIRTTTSPASGTYANQYRFDAGSTGALYTATDSNGKVDIRSEGAFVGSVASTKSVTDGAWHYIAMTWDQAAGTATLYVDGGSGVAGGETDSMAYTPAVNAYTSTGRNQFGKGTNNASEYTGAADELAIWTTALSASQIAAQYQAAVPEPGTLALFGIGGLMALRRRRA